MRIDIHRYEAILECEKCGRLPYPRSKNWIKRRMSQHSSATGHVVWWKLIDANTYEQKAG